VQVATSPELTCGVSSDGSVHCWGDDKHQLYAQFEASGVRDVTRLALSPLGFQLCALHGAGAITCWGDDRTGQVSGANATPFADFVQLALGSEHACALRTGGQLMCWGDDASGKVSLPSAESVQAIREVGVGGDFTCVIRADDSMSCWGGPVVIRTRELHESGVRSLVATQRDLCFVKRESSELHCRFAIPHDESDATLAVPAKVAESERLALADFGCTLGAGKLHCWGSPSARDVNQASAELSVRDVAIDSSRVCVVLEGGRLHCFRRAGRDRRPELRHRARLPPARAGWAPYLRATQEWRAPVLGKR
jgi:hypothetical protein